MELLDPGWCADTDSSAHNLLPVDSGQRVVFDVLIPPACHGIAPVLVFYVTDSSTDSERFTLVGRSAEPVGSASPTAASTATK